MTRREIRGGVDAPFEDRQVGIGLLVSYNNSERSLLPDHANTVAGP